MGNSKEYPATTRSRMDCLWQNLIAKGIAQQSSDSATLEYSGVKLSVNYDEPAQLLKVDILDKPVFVPESLIWQFIDSSVEKCP